MNSVSTSAVILKGSSNTAFYHSLSLNCIITITSIQTPEIIKILVIVVIKILTIIKLHCAIRAEMPVASQHQSWLPAPAVLVHASR